MPNVLLHIGMPKTGTTSLQRFFTLNAPALKGGGLNYPKPVIYSAYQHKSVAMYVAPKFRFFRTRQEQKELEAEIRQLCESVQSDEGTTLISSEWLYGVNPKYLAKIFPPPRTKIVIYLRDQINYLTSYYQEVVTLFPVTEGIDDFAKRERHLNYEKTLDKWVRVFGEKNLIVRIYDRDHLYRQNIIYDFFDAINFDLAEDDYNFKIGSSNPSLGGELLEFKRVLNRVLESPKEQREKLRNTLKAIAGNQNDFQIKPRINQNIKSRIIEKYDASNRRLFDKYNFDGQYFDYSVSGDGEISEMDPLRFFEILSLINQVDKVAYNYIVDKLYNNSILDKYTSFDKLKTILSYL